jgi:hypothetical protein
MRGRPQTTLAAKKDKTACEQESACRDGEAWGAGVGNYSGDEPADYCGDCHQGDRDREIIVEADGGDHEVSPDTPTLGESWFIPEKR